MMILDGLTLLAVNLIFTSFITLIWVLSAYVFKNSPSISINFALGDFFIGCFVFFYVGRTIWPNHLLIYIASDIGVTLGSLFIMRATQQFTEVKNKDSLLVALFLFGLAVDIFARYFVFTKLAVSIICAIGCYGLARAWHNAYFYMIKNFRKSYSIITAGPLFFISLLLGFRALLVFFAPEVATTDLRVGNQFNTGFLIVMLVAIIGFNATAIGLVISKMITKIRTLSEEDPLTRTFNRRHLNVLAEEEISKVRKNNSCFSLIVLDIDHFKKVNDVYGHAAGDAALVTCVEVIRGNIRSTDYIGRLGGEEFCILLPNTDSENARVLAERIRANIESHVVQWEDKQIPITASFGVTSFYGDAQNEWSNLLNKADQAMYKAKNNGRNQIVSN